MGFIGEGNYKIRVNNILTPQYHAWSNMMNRCYSEKFKEKHPTYRNCLVDSNWHNYQNFAKWYDNNYYEVDSENMHLDKDILIKGNKVYSPETCVFVPQRINLLIVKNDAIRGDLPLGVTWNKGLSRYTAHCSDENGKRIYLGYHDSPKQAFEVYKAFKEQVIRNLTMSLDRKIPLKLYDALLNYRIDISD